MSTRLLYVYIVILFIILMSYFLFFCYFDTRKPGIDLTISDVSVRMKKRTQAKLNRFNELEAAANKIEESKWESFWDGSMLPVETKILAKNSSIRLTLIDRGCDPNRISLLCFPKKWNVSWGFFPTKEVSIFEEANGVRYIVEKDDELVLTTKMFEINKHRHKVKAEFSGKGLVRFHCFLSGGGIPPKVSHEAFIISEQKELVDFILKDEKSFTKFYLAIRISGDITCTSFFILQTIE